MTPTDNSSEISGLKMSGVVNLRLSVNPEKVNRKVRGDWGWPVTNPLMVKLVFYSENK